MLSLEVKAGSGSGRRLSPADVPGYLRSLVPRRVRELRQAGEQALKEYMDVVAAEMGKRSATPYAPGARADGVQQRSGRAHDALTTYKTKDTADGAEAKFTVPGYLKAHEYGAMIRARASTYLAIPLPAALNADGTPKHFRAREWDRTFVIKSRRGNLLVVRHAGRRRYESLYILKKHARIPAQLGMRKTMVRLGPSFKKNMLRLIAAEQFHI